MALFDRCQAIRRGGGQCRFDVSMTWAPAAASVRGGSPYCEKHQNWLARGCEIIEIEEQFQNVNLNEPEPETRPLFFKSVGVQTES